MRILSAVIPVRDTDAAARFFLDVLDLPVGTTDDGTTEVQVGASRLELRHDDQAVGMHHLALAVPAEGLAAARAWLVERTDLLTDASGADEFEAPAGWDARSVYFAGPEGSVLELIAHRSDGAPFTAPFDAGSILRISEVGVAVDDVRDAVGALVESAGLAVFGEAHDDFAAVGDAEGLLIVVRTGRVWFPTTDRRAGEDFVTVTASGGVPGTLAVGGAALLSLEA